MNAEFPMHSRTALNILSSKKGVALSEVMFLHQKR